mmetsp:Transcript_19912/g.51756  ORF Transcript_19912/g.51756 Transcript_19912/m.51756 type:complete len:98 (-) Transcript_19912:32-325(-)
MASPLIKPRGRCCRPSCSARRRAGRLHQSDGRQKKRPRSMSEAAVFSDRLVALDEAQREEPEEPEEPIEEDEPDDYMRDYYDEDQDPVDGDGDEQVL